ncbi:ABC transporter, partial [Candidatus Electrothrix marina]
MKPVSILETRNLVKEYRARRVVDQVNLQVRNGSIVGLLGPNGAGKTTTFYSIVGFIRPTSGAIFLDNREIQGLPIHRRASRGITYLAQEPSVFKKLTVEENVRIVLEPLGLTRNEINNRISELMAELKIEYLAENKGHALSGGERRRVEIMR